MTDVWPFEIAELVVKHLVLSENISPPVAWPDESHVFNFPVQGTIFYQKVLWRVI